jgi:hypothetical protein
MDFGWDNRCFVLENTVKDTVGNIWLFYLFFEESNRWLMIEHKLRDIKGKSFGKICLVT